jgi:hypothetical protein
MAVEVAGANRSPCLAFGRSRVRSASASTFSRVRTAAAALGVASAFPATFSCAAAASRRNGCVSSTYACRREPKSSNAGLGWVGACVGGIRGPHACQHAADVTTSVTKSAGANLDMRPSNANHVPPDDMASADAARRARSPIDMRRPAARKSAMLEIETQSQIDSMALRLLPRHADRTRGPHGHDDAVVPGAETPSTLAACSRDRAVRPAPPRIFDVDRIPAASVHCSRDAP